MKKTLAFLFCALLLTACQPKWPETPTYRYPNRMLVELSAQAHANEIGGYVASIAPTGSMRPVIQDYDLVVISSPKKDPYENLQKGDIVRYDATSSPYFGHGTMFNSVIHRAVYQDKDGWIMSGDNNAMTEMKWRLTKETYLGKLVAIYRLDAIVPPAAK